MHHPRLMSPTWFDEASPSLTFDAPNIILFVTPIIGN